MCQNMNFYINAFSDDDDDFFKQEKIESLGIRSFPKNHFERENKEYFKGLVWVLAR